MSRLALALTLLAGPALAQDAGAPSTGTDPLLLAADAALAKDDAGTAVNVALTVLDDPAKTASHPAALARLGAALPKLGFPYAGLAVMVEGVDADTAGSAPVLPTLLDLATRFDEEIWVGGVADDFSVPMDARTRSHLAFVGARHAFDQASWGPALGLLPLVGSDDPWSLDAEVLQGVALVQQGRYGEALVPLLTSYEQARGTRDERYTATLAMNVARTFFASGNFGRAMEYYDKVPRSDAAWPEAHFERAWAHFRVDDMPGTLGVLQTHSSPFFEDWYLPEADLLRAQALYLMCKFPSTTAAIDDFQSRYTGMKQELDAALAGMGPADAFDEVVAWRAGKDHDVPAGLLRRWSSDQRLDDAIAAIEAADGEIALLGRQTTPWAPRAKTALEARRDARVRAEGRRILDAWTTASADLADMLEGIELTRIDLLSFEADLYQRAAATGQLEEMGDKVGKVRELRRKGKHVWPFQGEFWADELGWYRVTARPDCPESLQRGE